MAATMKPTSLVPIRSTCLGRGMSLPRSVIWYSLVGPHQSDFLPLFQFAIDHADVDDHAAIIVVDAVEDQRPRRRVGIALAAAEAGRTAW